MATYIIRAGLSGAVKIGRANDVERRREQLQTGNPDVLVVLRVVDTPFDAEPMFHERFKGCRLRGEWFEFDAAMLTFVPEPPATWSVSGLGEMLARIGIKEVARRIQASARTVENWVHGRHGPTWKHNVAMLQDDLLAPVLLKAAGREDLADPEKAILGLARQVIAKHGPDHPVLQRPDVRAVLEAAAAK